MYAVHSHTGKTTTSAEIIAKLDRSSRLHLAHIRAIENLERNGSRYSNQDFDVLAAAHAVALTGRREIHTWEQGWVTAMVGA